MKTIISILFLTLGVLHANCQETQNPEQAFDFWVGDWNIYYFNKNNVKLHGRNNILKTLDETVIQENFVDTNTNFKGTSISVYNPKKKEWHQAWADNKGGYFNFIGEIDGDKRIFKTLPQEKNGAIFIQRMVFHHITKNSFTWDWESSNDGGKTWKLNWQLFYERLA